MRILERYEIDNDKLTDGIWFEHEGSKFKLAHADSDLNPRYGTAVEEYRTKVLTDPSKEDLTPQQAKEAVSFAFFKAILTDWDWEDGIKRDAQQTKDMFKRCPLLYYVCLARAREYDRYRKHHREEDLGNSSSI